jgi:hypothetical protein
VRPVDCDIDIDIVHVVFNCVVRGGQRSAAGVELQDDAYLFSNDLAYTWL